MVVGITAIKQNGLFDEPLAGYLREKIDVFLGAGGAHSDVMNTCDL